MGTVNKIASFAVFDLEATNLPDYNFNKANITEIAIHGFSAEEVRKAKTCDIPRINHKLTLLFNPRMVIHPDAEKITGLNNYMLEGESYFDVNAANVIVNFLKHLKQPVCLVAHNGDNFDFRILKHQLDKHEVKLPSDVLCIDTLVAIKDLDRIAEEKEEIPPSQGDETVMPLPDHDDSVLVITSAQEEKEQSAYWKKLNETTPKRPPNPLTAVRKRKKQVDCEAETTSQNIKSRRSLFESSSKVKNIRNQHGKYKLENIYHRFFDKAPDVAHHAEADVVSLHKVMLRYGESFVEYAEDKAKPFADVKKVGAP